jgi:hypothetical protein
VVSEDRVSYQVDLVGLDGKTTTETHEDAQGVPGAGVWTRDGKVEDWIPWHAFTRATITPLDGDVRRPTTSDVPGRPTGGRRAR